VVETNLSQGLTPVAVATFRFLVAGGLFITALGFNRSRDSNYTLLVQGMDLLKMLLLSLLGVTFFFIIQYTGIELAGASISAILVCLLSPILISIFSAWFFKEHLTAKNMFGTLVAAAGTMIVIVGGTMSVHGNNDTFLFGSLILLLTPFMWAIYTIIGKRMMEKYDPFLVVAYVNILGGLCLVPFALAENSFPQALSMNTSEWLSIVYLAVACSLIGYFIWFRVMKQVRASVTSSFLFGEPLITAIFATAFANEHITISTIAGGLLIFLGVFLVTRK
jgi:drug/metabolite transporter (DMT)-like permease